MELKIPKEISDKAGITKNNTFSVSDSPEINSSKYIIKLKTSFLV